MIKHRKNLELSDQGQKLLLLLVSEINNGRFKPSEPETFLGYNEVLAMLCLPSDAPRGETDGQTLQLNGLNNLASWINAQRILPKITGLIVWKTGPEKNSPGRGYFREYGIPKNGREYDWWLKEVEKSIVFDWSPYLPTEEYFNQEEIQFVGDVFEGAVRQVPVTIRQRSERLRDLARKHFRKQESDNQLHCAVCNWTKPDIPVTHEIIEIHHTEEINTLPPNGRKISVKEALKLLIPLCPRCHRILHAKQGGGCFTVNELQKHINVKTTCTV